MYCRDSCLTVAQLLTTFLCIPCRAGTTVEASFPMAVVYHSLADKLLLVVSKVQWIPAGGVLFTAAANRLWKRWTEPISGTPAHIVQLMDVPA